MKTLIVAILFALHSPQALATSPQCTLLAAQIASKTPTTLHLSKKGFFSSGGSTFTSVGILVLFDAGLRANFGSVSPARHAAGSATCLVGSTLLALAYSNIRIEVSDATRRYRRTPDYGCLVSELGRNRAEEFLADVYSEFTPREFALKYLEGDRRDQVLEVFDQTHQSL
jgi:hypothetical protein